MPTSPPPPPFSYRRARVENSLAHLYAHPAVNPTGPHSNYVSPSPTSQPSADSVPSGIIQALFDDLVRRELGVDPTSTSPSRKRALVESHLSNVRSVAPKPSLSEPHFVRRLSTGQPISHLTEPSLIAPVAPKPVKSLHAPDAAAIHLAIQKARAERSKSLADQKKSETTPASNPEEPPPPNSLRRSTRARASPQKTQKPADKPSVESQLEKVKNPAEPPEITALRPSAEAVRRTRSASRKVRRLGSNNTPSECCFCPDPSLFGGKEIDSELIGPFVNRRGQAKLFVHFDCACWAPQVFTDAQTGQLRRVYDEYSRGRKLKCSECGGRGATIGCYVQKCKHVYHFRCLARSGAKRVERFFVAFCANHAHLGENKSYQILLEAATIADVAAANRRQDTTFGLDAPHSKYTQLRRRETEVIFSRRMGVCSHPGVYETTRVVFSHRRKRALSRTDRLSISDHARSLLASAFDVASGRLAYMSVVGREKIENMTAVEARAALASRENSSIFLLRNLRNAPRWTKSQISLIKKSDGDVSAPGVAAAESCDDSDDYLLVLPKGQRDSKQSIPGQDVPTHAAEDKPATPANSPAKKEGSPSPSPRRSKRRRVKTVTCSDEDSSIGEVKTMKDQIQSTALPPFKKSIAGSVNEPAAVLLDNSNAAKTKEDISNKSLKYPCPPQIWPPQNARYSNQKGRRRTALKITKETVAGDNEDYKARDGLAGKIKSAWETFLEEQLPKERLLRPDDNEADAMRNMARLWSYLGPKAREEYQERARQAACAPVDETLSNTAKAQSANGMEQNSKKPSQSNAGLFAGKEMFHSSTPHAKDGEKSEARRQAPSVSLPRKRKNDAGSGSGKRARYEFVEMDWDDLLPTSLPTAECSSSPSGESRRNQEALGDMGVVRCPPRSKSS